MKKVFLLGAMVCALGMMTACKSGINNENKNDTIQEQPEGVIFKFDGNTVMQRYADAEMKAKESANMAGEMHRNIK